MQFVIIVLNAALAQPGRAGSFQVLCRRFESDVLLQINKSRYSGIITHNEISMISDIVYSNGDNAVSETYN